MIPLRVGKCVDCGACCTLFTSEGYKTCNHYNSRTVHHCRIYHNRPEPCRLFPRTPMDIENKLSCGYSFVDEYGRIVDGYMDKRVLLRLVK
jgi:Fe-S-cluster containining protein